MRGNLDAFVERVFHWDRQGLHGHRRRAPVHSSNHRQEGDTAARNGYGLLYPLLLGAASGQLDLEQHGERTFEGVAVRVAQRILAMAAAIWRNHRTGAPSTRSLAAFDH